MLTLTSAQEAALNAAGEAMLDIHQADGPTFMLGKAPYAVEDDQKFQALLSGTDIRESVWGRGATGAAAVKAVLHNYEEAKNAPLKLRTAKEAIEAIKKIADENSDAGGDVALADLLPAIDALPVA